MNTERLKRFAEGHEHCTAPNCYLCDILALIADWEAATANNRRTICVYCGKVQQFDALVTWEILKESMATHLDDCPTHPINMVLALETELDRLRAVEATRERHSSEMKRKYEAFDAEPQDPFDNDAAF